MIIANNALGSRIDVPDIQAVIHVDMPTTIKNYAQQSGRGTRRPSDQAQGAPHGYGVSAMERDYAVDRELGRGGLCEQANMLASGAGFHDVWANGPYFLRGR